MSYNNGVHEGRVHILVVLPREPGEDFDYEVEHHDDCPQEVTSFSFGAFDGEMVEHTCDMGQYISYQGLEGLMNEYEEEFHEWQPGRYKIRTWSEYHAYCNEWDGGLEFLGREDQEVPA